MINSSVDIHESEYFVSKGTVEKNIRQAEIMEIAKNEIFDSLFGMPQILESVLFKDVAESRLVSKVSRKIVFVLQDVWKSYGFFIDILSFDEVVSCSVGYWILTGQY
jgi:hypothetical protein